MKYGKILDRFRDRKILVVGDLILDKYVWGSVNRISPEAPVPVVEVSRENYLLGGAANVAHNIVSLGGKASVVGVVGRDRAGETVVAMLREKGVACDGVFSDERPTTLKTRVIAHSQQVVRFDREDSSSLDEKTLRRVIEHIRTELAGHDAVIISDYKKGMVTPSLVRRVVRLARRMGRFVAVDPKVGHFDFYRGASLVTPNLREAADGAGFEIRDEESLLRAGRTIMKRLACETLLVTRGEDGMSLFHAGWVKHIPTVARKVYDVTGAGDTVISAFTLAHMSGSNLEDAAVIANHAAGIVVGEVGTAVATREQVLTSFGEPWQRR